MGLKCSLLGHSFGETDVERDRAERGNEVVTVVREVERCSRCGQTRIVSENKEVTSIVEPDEGGPDGAPDETESASTAPGNAATNVDDMGWSTGEGDVGKAYEPPEDPDEEDAEILRDDGSSERRPGQWPDDDEDWSPDRLTGGSERSDEAGDDGVNIAEDATAAPDVMTDDAEFIDADAAHRDASASGDDGRRSDGAAEGGVDGTGDTESSRPAATAEEGATGDGTYVCPECGFTRGAENSPLREGDACPECQQGYLVVENR